MKLKNLKILSLTFLLAVLIYSCGDGKSPENQQENNLAQQTPIQEVKTLSEKDFSKIDFQFTAYKTPEKVGVGGTFRNIYLKANQGETLAEIMEGAEFTIDAKSVDTGLPERDMKIAKYFFENLSSPIISGSFNSFSEQGFDILIKMNGLEKSYHVESAAAIDSLSFDFPIDVIEDFSASASLEGIAKACEVLHQGKTWSEVKLTGTVVK